MPNANPNPAIEQVALAIEDLPGMIGRFLPGFTESNRAAQAPGLPNHVIWTLGHVALYHHRAAERIEGVEPGPLPEPDFCMGEGASGEPNRFDSEGVCFASTPSPDASRYPSLARGIEIHANACERLARAVRGLDDAACQRAISWGAAPAPMSALMLATRMIHHVGTHAGQILDLRRALGLPRALG